MISPVYLNAGAWVKVRLLPNDGNINDINIDGNWICKRNGIYSIDVGFRTLSIIGANHSWIKIYKNGNAIRGSQTSGVDAIGCFVKNIFNPGDTIEIYFASQIAGQLTDSSFAITLDSSIEITTWNVYETWKAQDPPNRDGVTFDEWVDIMLRLGDDELSQTRAMLAWGNAELGVEYWTGKRHTDGRKIYGKKIDFGNMGNGVKMVNHYIVNFGELINTDCSYYHGTEDMFSTISTTFISSNIWGNPFIHVTETNVIITNQLDLRVVRVINLFIEYTCTDR
jgi:hypothetical protein